MTRFAAILTVVAALALGSCAHVGPVVDAGKVCATEAGKATVDEILPKVNAAIGCSISDPSAIPQCVIDGLEQIAHDYAQDFVICALEQIASGRLAEPGDTAAPVRQRRARAYLDSRKAQAGICCGCGVKRV